MPLNLEYGHGTRRKQALSAMTAPFFAASFSASRADTLIGQIQTGLSAQLPTANTGLILADEACGQAFIDKVVDWLRAELGGPVLALPVLGQTRERAQVQVLIGSAGTHGFGPITDWSFDGLAASLSAPAAVATRLLALDPRTPFFAQRLSWMHEAGEAYLMGAMGAPAGLYRGPSGLGFDLATPLICETFQGVERMRGAWTITAAAGQVVHEIDERPALDVLVEVAGDILARKLAQIPQVLYPTFPVAPADPDDFVVRRIDGLGQQSRSFSIDDEVLPGMPLGFARRNGKRAMQDVQAGVKNLRARAGAPPRAALYLWDQDRQVDFGDADAEVALVRTALEDVPLIAGAVRGVISHDRLYRLASQLIFIL